jgi:alginate O-acetyltransferase complex protein AlgI
MFFNSNEFLVFLGVFVAGYVLVQRSLRLRNLWIVIASYFFYAWWDYRFVALLLTSSLVDFFVGQGLGRTKNTARRKCLLGLSLLVNLGALFFFKYVGFFQESLQVLLESFGFQSDWRTLQWVLPVGISFYTFQSLGYTIDVFRGKNKPSDRLLDFLAYVSFFPQLVAGPIERASNLLPQFQSKLRIDRGALEIGLWLVTWGLFKKVVIADNLAPLVDLAFGHSAATAPVLLLGTLAFGFQIYCDFSGYTDIARGVARWLGFRLMINFNLPYVALNLADFWRRWHISLSTWLRDYLYIPLGGNRRGVGRTYLNLGLVMLLGGLWHGASMNFVLWGLWHGMGLSLHRAFAGHVRISKFVSWGLTMVFVFFGWFLFRVTSVEHLYSSLLAFTDWGVPVWGGTYLLSLGVLLLPLLGMQFFQWHHKDLNVVLKLRLWARSIVTATLAFLVFSQWHQEGSPFIYFQF